jgi:hypothetical protein
MVFTGIPDESVKIVCSNMYQVTWEKGGVNGCEGLLSTGVGAP